MINEEISKKKYKPCCDLRCIRSFCPTRDLGGCNCVCRLKDAERNCLGILDGTLINCGIYGFTYNPNVIPVPLVNEEKEKILNQIKNIQDKLKKYEL